MFGEKRFNSNEMAASFRNSIWRQPPYLILIRVLISDSAVAFNIVFATSSPRLVRIGQIVKELQSFSQVKMVAAAMVAAAILTFGEFAFFEDTVKI